MTNKISTSMLARSRPSKTGMELFKDLEHHKFIKRDTKNILSDIESNIKSVL